MQLRQRSLDTSLSVLDLDPESPEFSPPQFINSLAPSPSVTQSDCAAELAATMGRLLASASSTPGPHRETPKVSSGNSPAVRCRPVTAHLALVESLNNVVERLCQGTSHDTRSDRGRQSRAAAMEAWVPSRLERHGQVDELPPDGEHLSPSGCSNRFPPNR